MAVFAYAEWTIFSYLVSHTRILTGTIDVIFIVYYSRMASMLLYFTILANNPKGGITIARYNTLRVG